MGGAISPRGLLLRFIYQMIRVILRPSMDLRRVYSVTAAKNLKNCSLALQEEHANKEIITPEYPFLALG